MRYFRCKCGDAMAFGTDSPPLCSRCNKCGSDLSSHPDYHKEPQPHKMKKQSVLTDDNNGFITRCVWCWQTKAELEEHGEPMEFDEGKET